MAEERPDVRHTMVITLKSGVQIRVDVKSYEAKRRSASGELIELAWELDDDPLGNSIGYINVGEVASVHSEREAREPGLIPVDAKP